LRETESIVETSVEAGKPYIPALKRPEVKSVGIAAFLSLSVEAKKETAARAVVEFGRPSSAEPRHFICYARIARSSLRARRCTRALDLGDDADGLPGARIFRLQSAPGKCIAGRFKG
jgi:hypothetical protein